MDEKHLNELKYYFGVAMSKNSTQAKSMIEPTWETIVKNYSHRPYHNLSLIYSDLNIARKLNCSISDEIIVAYVLQYHKFNASNPKHVEEAVDHIAYLLKEPFGWREPKIKEVLNLIAVDNRIYSIIPRAEPYAIQLMHDMKMSRFAKPREDFAKDRLNATTEYKHVDYEYFVRSEHAFLICQQCKPELFCLDSFKVLTAKARDNMTMRLTFLNNRIQEIESRTKNN